MAFRNDKARADNGAGLKSSVQLGGNEHCENTTLTQKHKPADCPVDHRRVAVTLLRLAGGADSGSDRHALMMEAGIRLSVARALAGGAAHV